VVNPDPTLDLGERLARVLGAKVEGLRRLTGGASRETWSFDAIDTQTDIRRELVLRRDPPQAPRDGMELEARLLAAAAKAGVPVPTVRAAGPADPARLESSYLVMDRVEGETIARKILRDPQYASARTMLAAQCGEALAKLHSIDPAIVDLLDVDPLEKYREVYNTLELPIPVFEWAFRWLDEHRPTNPRRTLVHGDFRLGNLIVGPDGLCSVLDWELAHRGNPMEDMGWLCVRAWRFGGAQPVAGLGTHQELFDAYEAAGGGPVDPAAVHWWTLAGTVMWGVMCAGQGVAHLTGPLRSVELAAIGRRVAEQEHDVLLLMAPEVLAGALAQPMVISAPMDTRFGRPNVVQLVEAVREFLDNDVMVSVEGRVQFHARVASNVLAMVERELMCGAEFNWYGYPSEASLAAAIRTGALDAQASSLLPVLAATVATRVRVVNPKHIA